MSLASKIALQGLFKAHGAPLLDPAASEADKGAAWDQIGAGIKSQNLNFTQEKLMDKWRSQILQENQLNREEEEEEEEEDEKNKKKRRESDETVVGFIYSLTPESTYLSTMLSHSDEYKINEEANYGVQLEDCRLTEPVPVTLDSKLISSTDIINSQPKACSETSSLLHQDPCATCNFGELCECDCCDCKEGCDNCRECGDCGECGDCADCGGCDGCGDFGGCGDCNCDCNCGDCVIL